MTADDIREWTARNTLARRAYRADMEVQDGRCERLDGRPVEKGRRRCLRCGHGRAT